MTSTAPTFYATAQYKGKDGSLSEPSFSYINNTETGWQLSNPNELTIQKRGVKRVRIASDVIETSPGTMSILATDPTLPVLKFTSYPTTGIVTTGPLLKSIESASGAGGMKLYPNVQFLSTAVSAPEIDCKGFSSNSVNFKSPSTGSIKMIGSSLNFNATSGVQPLTIDTKTGVLTANSLSVYSAYSVNGPAIPPRTKFTYTGLAWGVDSAHTLNLQDSSGNVILEMYYDELNDVNLLDVKTGNAKLNNGIDSLIAQRTVISPHFAVSGINYDAAPMCVYSLKEDYHATSNWGGFSVINNSNWVSLVSQDPAGAVSFPPLYYYNFTANGLYLLTSSFDAKVIAVSGTCVGQIGFLQSSAFVGTSALINVPSTTPVGTILGNFTFQTVVLRTAAISNLEIDYHLVSGTSLQIDLVNWRLNIQRIPCNSSLF